MSNLAISVSPDPAHALAFDVVVRDARGESRHRVTMSADDAARFAKLGADPLRAVEAAMKFLVDREPKEAILSAFDIRVIRRYFPEFDDAFPGTSPAPAARREMAHRHNASRGRKLS